MERLIRPVREFEKECYVFQIAIRYVCILNDAQRRGLGEVREHRRVDPL